jgi:hypothetical protein
MQSVWYTCMHSMACRGATKRSSRQIMHSLFSADSCGVPGCWVGGGCCAAAGSCCAGGALMNVQSLGMPIQHPAPDEHMYVQSLGMSIQHPASYECEYVNPATISRLLWHWRWSRLLWRTRLLGWRRLLRWRRLLWHWWRTHEWWWRRLLRWSKLLWHWWWSRLLLALPSKLHGPRTIIIDAPANIFWQRMPRGLLLCFFLTQLKLRGCHVYYAGNNNDALQPRRSFVLRSLVATL